MLMKKFLRYSFVAFLAVMGFSNAVAEEISATQLAAIKDGAVTVGNFTFSAEKNAGSTAPTYNEKGLDVRIYAKGTLTIKSTANNFKKVVFTISTQGLKRLAPITASVGTIATQAAGDKTVTWEGDANEVVLTVGDQAKYGSDGESKAGQFDFSSVSITVDGEATTDPDPDPQPQPSDDVKTVTIAEFNAAEVADDVWYQLTGTVKNLKSGDEYGNFDLEDETASVYVYGLLSEKGGAKKQFQTLAAEKGIQNGSKLTLIGTRGVYNEKIEVLNAYFVSVDNTGVEPQENPEDAITKGLTADAPMTVDEALAYIDGFENGFITSKDYYVQGDVAEVKEISTTNGNATFTMAGTNGTLTIYRVKGLENKNIADEGYLREQDQVVVLAKLQKYVKGEVVTPEMSSGYIYMLNGETKDDTPEPQPVDFEGDGSKENPYTVADLKKMNSATYPAEAAWVKGVIVGSAKSGSALHEGTETDADVASNIAIAATADATEFVPVQLASGTDFRTNLNVVDNPTVIGKEVKLCGTITAYFSVTGLKNLTDYVLEGGESIQGDANGDGVVDVADVDFVIEAIGGEYAQAADVNGDGAVDVADVDFIIEQIQ